MIFTLICPACAGISMRRLNLIRVMVGIMANRTVGIVLSQDESRKVSQPNGCQDRPEAMACIVHNHQLQPASDGLCELRSDCVTL